MGVDELYSFLKSGTFNEIFGAEVEQSYRKYSILCHPDICTHPIAKECFQLLTQRKNRGDTPLVIFNKKYTCENTTIAGDISTVYDCGGHYVKVSSNKALNPFVNSEYETLKKFVDKSSKSFFKGCFPKIVENFTVDGLSANVFKKSKRKFYTIEQVHDIHPALEGRHVGWILNRLLEIVSYTHSLGYVHANIIPNNFLVDIENHQGLLLGWTNASKVGGKARIISKTYNKFFPSEVLDKKSVAYETDIYMIGQLGKYLNPNLPKKISSILSAMTIPNIRLRPDNTIDLLVEFKRVLEETYEKPSFVVLEMKES